MFIINTEIFVIETEASFQFLYVKQNSPFYQRNTCNVSFPINFNSTNVIRFIFYFILLHFTIKGVFRECFSTSFKLGRRSNPVKVTNSCQLQRTQSDPKSTIRACICTSDYCNGQEGLETNNNLIGDEGTTLETIILT